MTKGNLDGTNGKPTVATAANQSTRNRKTGDGELASKPAVQSRTKRVLRPADRAAQPADIHVNDSRGTGAKSKPGTPDTTPKAPSAPAATKAGTASKRLTPTSEARLRDATPVTIEAAAISQAQAASADESNRRRIERAQAAAIKHYEFGHEAGYARGIEASADIHNQLVSRNRMVSGILLVVTVILALKVVL